MLPLLLHFTESLTFMSLLIYFPHTELVIEVRCFHAQVSLKVTSHDAVIDFHIPITNTMSDTRGHCNALLLRMRTLLAPSRRAASGWLLPPHTKCFHWYCAFALLRRREGGAPAALILPDTASYRGELPRIAFSRFGDAPPYASRWIWRCRGRMRSLRRASASAMLHFSRVLLIDISAISYTHISAISPYTRGHILIFSRQIDFLPFSAILPLLPILRYVFIRLRRYAPHWYIQTYFDSRVISSLLLHWLLPKIMPLST